MSIAKIFLSDSELNDVESMGRELNRDIVEELKLIKAELETTKSPMMVKKLEQIRRDLNAQRIQALGLKLIQGEKV